MLILWQMSLLVYNKLKVELTPFGIVHHSKGLPFQVHLTVSKLLIITVMILMFLDEVEQKERIPYSATSPLKTDMLSSWMCV